MEKIILVFGAATICSAIFLPLDFSNRKTMVNLCVYSVNPTKYMPKCYLCPTAIYSMVLQTCVNAAAIPTNVSYTQAICLEQNCAIGRGKRSISSSSEEDNSLEWHEHDSNSVELIQLPNKPQPKGNVSSNYTDDKSIDIVLEEETYASDDVSFEYEGDYDVD
ncbi:uncharacterized protein LOC129231201 [Uloborus diversus]|uniref:uncharacterized protein LOC129231201 n=1 Tax=Uloborus diversus TaxID=327109 RepID=UPI002409F9DE|nr:uncharacterized protein LOC129231201 [Uloborus diversus]XP_054721433.1 uncharacterized protein LOC129231201 [Uloborus diversus]